MGGVLFRYRAELRRAWRSWVALAVLAGVFAGLGIAALAGARRTETAYPRFVQASDAFDALVGGGGSRIEFTEALDRLRAHPDVVDAADVVMLGFAARLPAVRERPEQRLTFPSAIAVVDPANRALVELNRAKVLDGRLADPARADEAVVPFTLAERHDLRVGDRIELELGFEGGTIVEVEVVGIVASPGDFEAVGQQVLTLIWTTPALFAEHQAMFTPPTGDFWNLGVRLRDEPGAAERFRADALEVGLDIPTTTTTVTAGVQRSMRLYAAALWVFGGLIGLATLTIFGPASARLAQLAAREDPALRALGFSVRDVAVLALLRSMTLGVLAVLVAGVTAYLSSAAFPVGVARIAEPQPGAQLDPFVLLLGCALVLATFVLFAVPAAIRSGRRPVAAGTQPAQLPRRSTLGAFLGRRIDAPSIAAGVRMAFEPGRGDTAVPVRSTIVAVAGGVAAVALTLVVGASLTHLVDTPALAGFTYDAIVPDETEAPGNDVGRRAALEAVPGVEHARNGTAANVTFDGVDSFLVAFEDGPIRVALIAGREPTGQLHEIEGETEVPEIVLGAATMRRLGVEIGELVRFSYVALNEERGERAALVVGTAAVPALPWAVVEPGEGAAMALPALASFSGDAGGCCFVRFEPGADPGTVGREIQERGLGVAFLRGSRADLATLERLSGLPIVLISIFAIMGCAALAHVLLSAIRRRRREVAVLKTLGFVRRQVASTIAWQATAVAAACLLIGIPAGIGLGRWGWRLIASGFGVVPVVRVPTLALVLTAVSCLVVANVIAFVPARIAARTEPASTLRAE